MIELKSSQSGLRLGFRVHWTHTCLRLGLHWTRSQTWTYLLERASVCLLVSIITTAVTCLFFANRRWFSAQVSKTNLLLLFVNPRCPTSECAKITVRQVPQEASAHILLQKKRGILNKSKKRKSPVFQLRRFQFILKVWIRNLFMTPISKKHYNFRIGSIKTAWWG